MAVPPLVKFNIDGDNLADGNGCPDQQVDLA